MSLSGKKRVIVMFPPNRASKELEGIASACFTIGRAKLSPNQFPPIVTLANGFQLKKPELWDEAGYQESPWACPLS
jgi:hypothetical protein